MRRGLGLADDHTLGASCRTVPSVPFISSVKFSEISAPGCGAAIPGCSAGCKSQRALPPSQLLQRAEVCIGWHVLQGAYMAGRGRASRRGDRRPGSAHQLPGQPIEDVPVSADDPDAGVFQDCGEEIRGTAGTIACRSDSQPSATCVHAELPFAHRREWCPTAEPHRH